MGQAKNRGSREDRIQQAKSKASCTVIPADKLIAEGLDLWWWNTEDPEMCAQLMTYEAPRAFFSNPKRRQQFISTGKGSCHYNANGSFATVPGATFELSEAMMQKGIDKGIKQILFMDDDEATQYHNRHVRVEFYRYDLVEDKLRKHLPQKIQELAPDSNKILGRCFFGYDPKTKKPRQVSHFLLDELDKVLEYYKEPA